MLLSDMQSVGVNGRLKRKDKIIRGKNSHYSQSTATSVSSDQKDSVIEQRPVTNSLSTCRDCSTGLLWALVMTQHEYHHRTQQLCIS